MACCWWGNWRLRRGYHAPYSTGDPIKKCSVLAVMEWWLWLMPLTYCWVVGMVGKWAKVRGKNWSFPPERLPCCSGMFAVLLSPAENTLISVTHNCSMSGSHPNCSLPAKTGYIMSEARIAWDDSDELWASTTVTTSDTLSPLWLSHQCELIKTTRWCPVSHQCIYIYPSQECCLGPVLYHFDMAVHDEQWTE